MQRMHFVSLPPKKAPLSPDIMFTPNNFTFVQISECHNPHSPTGGRRENWMAWTISFFTACIMYGMGAYAMVRHIFSLLHTADALTLVDTFMKTTYGKNNGLDWNFFGPVGLTTVLVEMYALALTFCLMIRQYESIGNIVRQPGPRDLWGKVTVSLHFLVASMSLALILLFFYFATLYHLLIIHKVLGLSPHGDMAIELFHNHTKGLAHYNRRFTTNGSVVFE